MIVSDEADPRVVDDLATRIDNMLNEDPDLTQREIFQACLYVMSGVLAAIECHDCRRINARMLKKELPHMIKAALDVKSGGAASGHMH